jgi:hypothetical protein
MERTPEELAEVQRVHDLLLKALEQDVWKMAELMVSKRDDQLLGATEFALRDKVLQMGAKALEATIDDRKKRGIKAAVPSAQTVAKTRVSSTGGAAMS